MGDLEVSRESYSCSLITQGQHKFYSLTMPSEILAQSCFVSTRDEDPLEGFQRILDKARAKEIADYIDSGKGSIPTAIVLSAQSEADFKYVSKNKTVEFNRSGKSFLILDGQHRVFGFALANTSVRVPVIIYNGLSRKEETRLFIDINTKQRPVPTELLLDIKQLADYESDIDGFCREVFDLFNERSDSVMLGLLDPIGKTKGKLTRVSFNAAIKPIYNVFGEREAEEVYAVLNQYLKAMTAGLAKPGLKSIVKPTLFRAIVQLFPHVARLTNGNYSVDTFYRVLLPVFDGMSASKVQKANSIKEIFDHFMECLNKGFTL